MCIEADVRGCEHQSVWNIGDDLTAQYPLGLVSSPGCVTARAPAQGISPAVPLPATAPQHSHCLGAAPASDRYRCIFLCSD